jgi:hypothetical protein
VILARHFRPLCIVALGLLASACALAACSGADNPEITRDSGSDGSSSDAGRHDASTGDAAHDASMDALSDAGNCKFGPLGEAIELECAGLYSDWATKTVSPENKEFIPGLQLWSDGALKTRWVHLPTNPDGGTATIDTADMDEWTFPVGTKFWKEFRLPVGSSTTPTRIETRLIWKQGPQDWYRTTYRWSSDGETSATELTSGQLDANGDGYQIPTQTDCNTCHDGRLDGVLGFEAVGLSAPAASLVTMGTLVNAGLLTAPPTAPIVIPGDAIESDALAWFHVNCGTACHNRGNGQASSTGFWMRLDVATLATVDASDTYTTGWDQPTVGFHIPDLPDGSTTYRFEACDIAASAGYYRPDHRDGPDSGYGIQMPPIDTHRVDDAGIAEIAAWINEHCDAGAADAASHD